MNVLILAAGHAPEQHKDDYPLCLSEIGGIPLIQRIIETCSSIDNVHFIVAIRNEDARRYHLDNTVRLLAERSNVVRVPQGTQGAACTALLAVSHIDNQEELLILNGNELIDENFAKVIDEFRERGLAAGVITFESVHPRYSYVRLDSKKQVVEAAEKNPISRHATAGFYWFAHGADFVHAAQNTIRKGASVNGHFYICPVLNELVLDHAHIGTYRVSAQQYQPLKTEQQVSHFDAMVATRGAT